jgi:hypothetical protein
VTVPLACNGLVMPADFPVAPFEKAYGRALTRKSSAAALFEQFNAAWNAISIRFLTLASAGDNYGIAMARTYPGTDPERRYAQERALFEFFVNALAAIESYFFGLFAIGAILKPAEFPMATDREQQGITPSNAQKKFTIHFNGDAINAVLAAILGDSDYTEFKIVRNVLAHRTAPGRIVYASTGTAPPPEWKLGGILIDEHTLVKRRANASRMLIALLESAARFTEDHIV